MNEIEFRSDGIALREEVELFGEREIEELLVAYDERGGFELDLNTGGFVSLSALVDIERADGGDIQSVTLRLDRLSSADASARRREGDDDDSVPSIPDIDPDGIEIQARRRFYERLRGSSDSQPAEIRRLIYEEGQLDREEFDRHVEQLGYEPEGGGTSMSLVVLDEVTGEIERRGRGADQTIVWVGS